MVGGTYERDENLKLRRFLEGEILIFGSLLQLFTRKTENSKCLP